MPPKLTDFVSYADFTFEIRKHSDSDVLVALLADLRSKRINLKEFCEQVRRQLGNGVLMKTIVELERAKRVKLSKRRHVAAPPATFKSLEMAASCSRLCALARVKPGANSVTAHADPGDAAPPPMTESEVAEFLSVAQEAVGYEVFCWDLGGSSL